MKTTRQYVSGCTWCNATGFVKIHNPGFMSSALTGICPICEGAKAIMVTETTEDAIECLDCGYVCKEQDLINKTGKYSKDEIVCCPKCESKSLKYY